MPSDVGRSDRERPLTPKQARFVEEYLIDLNATQAALRAGYSAKSASDIGQQLIGKTHIARAIAEHKRANTEQLHITAMDVLKELAYLGHSDVRHYRMREDGAIDLAPGAPDYAMRAVSSVKMKRRTIPQEDGPPILEHDLEFRLWNKNDALTNLAKHFALLVERHEINITQQHLVAVRQLSDLELSAFLDALDQERPEQALKLLPGGLPGETEKFWAVES